MQTSLVTPTRQSSWKIFFVRIGIGALCGLILAPASRNLLLLPFLSTPAKQSLLMLSEENSGQVLTKPSDIFSESLWVRLFLQKVNTGQKIHPAEIMSFITIAQNGAKREPDNGFWKQALAIGEDLQGHRALAEIEWKKSAGDLQWQDHQFPNSQIFEDYPTTIASDYFILYKFRNSIAAQAAYDFNYKMLRENWKGKNGVEFRFLSVLNGSNIRKGAKSMAQMNIGVAIADSALQQPNGEVGNYKTDFATRRLIVARINLQELARRTGNKDLAEHMNKVFNENDSALALASKVNQAEITETMKNSSTLCDTLPFSSLLSSAWAVILCLIMSLRTLIQKLRHLTALMKSGLLASILLAPTLFAGFSLAAFTLVLAILFSSLSPSHVRTSPPARQGPLFELFCFLISVSLLLLTIWGGTQYNWYSRFYPSNLLGTFQYFLSFSYLVLSIIFLGSPLWAFVQKTLTGMILDRALILVSKLVLVISVLTCVVGTPICVELDRNLAVPIHQLSQNEPLYYVSL